MDVTPEKVEWLYERNCVYTLMHHGWHQGQEMKRNRLYFMVQRDSTVTEQEAEDTAAKIVKAVNAHDKLVEALKLAQEVSLVGIFSAARTGLLTRADDARKAALAAAGEPT